MMRDVEQKAKRAVVAAVHLPNVSDLEFEASVTELRRLAKTLGFDVVGTFTQKRRRFGAAAYLGLGKRQEMRRFVRNEPELDHVQAALPANEEESAAEDDEHVESALAPDAGGATRGAAREAKRATGKAAKREAAEA